jgi:hypothetical protein
VFEPVLACVNTLPTRAKSKREYESLYQHQVRCFRTHRLFRRDPMSFVQVGFETYTPRQ